MVTEPASVLVVDPPWGMRDNLPGKGRGARKHYPCMSIEALEQFELPPLADDCVMFLWLLSSMPREALRLVDAWGFREHSQLMWRKMTRTGAKEHFGMGRIVRGAHEPCMIAVRGRVPRVKSRSERSGILCSRGSAQREAGCVLLTGRAALRWAVCRALRPQASGRMDVFRQRAGRRQ